MRHVETEISAIAAALSDHIAASAADHVRRVTHAPSAAAILRFALQICAKEVRRVKELMTEPQQRFSLFFALADEVAGRLRAKPEFARADP